MGAWEVQLVHVARTNEGEGAGESVGRKRLETVDILYGNISDG